MRLAVWPLAAVFGLAPLVSGCTGTIIDASGPAGMTHDPGWPGGSGTPPVDPGAHASEIIVPARARRLTVREYANTVKVLLGETLTGSDLGQLPQDGHSPFDNDASGQQPSDQLVTAVDDLSRTLFNRLRAAPDKLKAVVGCTPAGADDPACMRTFIQDFGRRAFRRPLTIEEVGYYLNGPSAAPASGALAVARRLGDFSDGVEVAMRAMLQDPAFLYRFEIGMAVPGRPGLYALTPHEIATRLSYLLWEAPPEADPQLQRLADEGRLGDGASVRAQAAAMMGDGQGRGKDRLRYFHQQWLGLQSPKATGVGAKLFYNETSALIDDVVFGAAGRPWMDLFQADKTYVAPALAKHYGLPVPAAEGWVSYPDSRRRGILSHGSVLANGYREEHNNQIFRGKFILSRLLCQDISQPDADSIEMAARAAATNGEGLPRPPDDACNVDQTAYRLSIAGCAVCHRQMDPIGLGLAFYDGAGKVRSFETGKEPGKPRVCSIPGQGELELGAAAPVRFSGPARLAKMLLDANVLQRCSVTQLFRFALGRHEDAATDGALLGALERNLADKQRLGDSILDLASSEAFRYVRRAEQQP